MLRNRTVQDLFSLGEWHFAPGAGREAIEGPRTDGSADHCYHHGAGNQCSNTAPFEVPWLPQSQNAWSLAPNLDWLASFFGL